MDAIASGVVFVVSACKSQGYASLGSTTEASVCAGVVYMLRLSDFCSARRFPDGDMGFRGRGVDVEVGGSQSGPSDTGWAQAAKQGWKLCICILLAPGTQAEECAGTPVGSSPWVSPRLLRLPVSEG